MEQFFREIGCMDEQEDEKITMLDEGVKEALDEGPKTTVNADFKICPDCNQRSVKMENGCLICVDPNCGYSKCDK
jgi:hypothetical protein